MVTTQQTYRFTVQDYYRMGEVGILPPDARVELVDGEIRPMPPIHPPHASIVKRLSAILAARLGDTAVIGVQDPIHLDDYNEPQPDLTVMRFRDDYYATRHPTPADILLVIEVADTSLAYDRDHKIPRYAKYGIPEAWLVDVRSQTVTVFTNPHPDGYAQQRTLSRTHEIVSPNVHGLRIPVNDALG